jgi:hypothetical protein
MKEKLKNRTRSYLRTKEYNRLKVGDVVLFYGTNRSAKYHTGVIERKLSWGIVTEKYNVPYDLVFKKITHKNPEYLL